MTSEQHLRFIQFIEERRSTASTPATKAVYTIVKIEYMKIHSKNIEILDMDFKLIKDIIARSGDVIKAGEVFSSHAGLVSGVGGGFRFDNKTYFEPVNIKYHIK